MKLENKNPNYCATVVRIQNLVELEGLDNLVGMPIMGYQALMSKDHTVGELGILFTAETKLSEDFCYNNNLYRKPELNKNKEVKGYLESNCRVRAIRLRKHISSALFMPLSSLAFLGVDANDFKEGDSFTYINGVEVCCKYIIKFANERSNKVKGKTKIFSRIDALLFPEHQDTDNYWKNIHNIKDDDWIVVTDKLHGCVSEDTIVETNIGKKTIKEIVQNKLKVKIKAYDIGKDREVFVDIGNYYLKENHGEWYEIELENGETIKITGNNPIWLPDLGVYRRVDELSVGQYILYS